jgi:hypothetical protein
MMYQEKSGNPVQYQCLPVTLIQVVHLEAATVLKHRRLYQKKESKGMVPKILLVTGFRSMHLGQML